MSCPALWIRIDLGGGPDPDPGSQTRSGFRSDFKKSQKVNFYKKNIGYLKVVGNEKEGGSGKWQMIDIYLRLW